MRPELETQGRNVDTEKKDVLYIAWLPGLNGNSVTVTNKKTANRLETENVLMWYEKKR